MFCTKCGSELPEGSKFCERCGWKPEGFGEEPSRESKENPSGEKTSDPVPARNGQKQRKKVKFLAASLLAVAILFVAGWAVYGISREIRYRNQISLGERYLSELDYESAIIAFNKAIEIDPKRAEAYVGRGDAYALSGESGENMALAQEDYETAIALDERNEDAYVGLADVYALQGDYGKAEELLESGLGLVENPEKMEGKQGEIETAEIESKILRADEAAWVEEPVYAYEDVEPVYSPDFGLCSAEYGIFCDGVENIFPGGYGADHGYEYGVEMNFPSYSCLEEYYEILDGESLKLFYMPEKEASEEIKSPNPDVPWYSLYVNGDGIHVEYEPGMYDYESPQLNAPWDVLLFHSDAYVPYEDLALFFWDEASQQAYMMATEFYDLYTILVSVSDFPLHKAYAIREGKVTGDLIKGSSYWEDQSPTYEVQMDETSKYALLSKEGNLLTDFIYDDMMASSYGITAACKDGKWGYLDEQGKEITAFIYDGVWNIDSGRNGGFYVRDGLYAYPCTSDTMVVGQSGEMGVLYRDGSILIPFGEFEDLAPAWEDKLWAKKDGLWGLIDLADAKRKTGRMQEGGAAQGEPEELASYEIVRDEGDNHGHDVEVYFERPVFEETTLGYQLINEFFEGQSEEFFSDPFLNYEDRYSSNFWDLAEEAEEYPEENLCELVSAEVAYQSKNMVSIRLYHEEYLGGSVTNWVDCYLFHTDTGKRVALTDLIGESKEEVQGMVINEICKDYGIREEDISSLSDAISDYELTDFNFYLKDGKIHVTFSIDEISFWGDGGVMDIILPVTPKLQ